MKTILSNKQGFRIPHAELVTFSRANLVNLGINNDVASKIATVKHLGPTKTTAVAAYHFWNWILLIVFCVSIYWSFTKDWWWIIIGVFLVVVVSSANKKSNASNFLDAALIDEAFYNRVLQLDGWFYQVDDENVATFEKYRVN